MRAIRLHAFGAPDRLVLAELPDLTRGAGQGRLAGRGDAVAAVGTGRTAQGVLELEPPSAGDVVLVPSAAGGLGWLLAQAARQAGAMVVAAARGERRTAELAGLGADLVVDYGQPGWDAR